MTIGVRAKFSIIDNDTKLILVPQESHGVVEDTRGMPEPIYLVQFSVDGETISQWVGDDYLIWDDGPLGPVRALVELEPRTITSVTYPQTISDTDFIIGEQYAQLRSRARVQFDGFWVDIVSDRNTGDLRFEVGIGGD